MRRTDTVVIGGGQAGLAMSRCLSDRGIEHVVLERGRVAERWRSERWDSLRLQTPRWQTRLPSQAYDGDAPDGYMTMTELIAYLERYAREGRAPIEERTTVTSVTREADAYRVETTRGSWDARNVVVATGHCDVPWVPPLASELGTGITQLTSSSYRNPHALPDGGVLVVGGAASGVQIADELARAGRAVLLSVGGHTRVPRRYRGRDIMWWMDRIGVLDERIEDMRDVDAVRRQPSLQLVGDDRTIDLSTLRERGVRFVGRVALARKSRVAFAGDLARSVARSESRRLRLLARIDRFIAASRLDAAFPEEPPARTLHVAGAPTIVNLRRERIATIVWATGYTRSYPWLRVPVLDGRGEIIHQGGVTTSPGLYVLGLRFLRTRKSSFLDGVGDDAKALAEHIWSRRAERTAA